jgi:hypothetical protein
MKTRLLVMNGQKVVQTEQGGSWVNKKVEKSGLIKAGIYPLYMGKEADAGKKYDGLVIHSDEGGIYQAAGKSITLHKRSSFDIVPDVGSAVSIQYGDEGRVVGIGPADLSMSRGKSR